MKRNTRAALLLTALLCLLLTACGQQTEPGTPDEPSVPVSTPLVVTPRKIGALNVEFAAGGRDVNALLALQKKFPQALTDALKKQNVEVDAVNVTFGTSDEATAAALMTGAVDIGFLPAATVMEEGMDGVAAVEQGEGPDLSLGMIVLNQNWETARVTDIAAALRAALPDLQPVLTRYAGVRLEAGENGYEEHGGVYVRCTDDLLDNLYRLYETGDAVLHTETAVVDNGRELTLNGVGHKLNDYNWGVRSIEVYDGEELLQTIEMAEAADDPDVGLGLDGYTDCWTPEQTFRAVDVNFDGHEDVEVFGWAPNNTIPYFYWLWNPDTGRYEYAFGLQGTTVHEDTKTLTAEYRESAAEYYRDTYRWKDGALVRTERQRVE